MAPGKSGEKGRRPNARGPSGESEGWPLCPEGAVDIGGCVMYFAKGLAFDARRWNFIRDRGELVRGERSERCCFTAGNNLAGIGE